MKKKKFMYESPFVDFRSMYAVRFLTMGIKRKVGVVKVLTSTNLVVKFKICPLNIMSSITQWPILFEQEA